MGSARTARDFVDKVKAVAERGGIRDVFVAGPDAPTSAELEESLAARQLAEAAEAALQEEKAEMQEGGIPQA